MDILKPSLTVTIDPSLKTYTVTARVVAPNGCYMSGGALPVAPAGQLHIPSAQPLTLKMVRQDGLCTQALKVIEYTIAALPLSEGIDSVVAFLVVNDVVVATAATPIIFWQDKEVALLAPYAKGPVASSGVIVQSVNGWINAMPVGDPTLIVIVNVWAPCANYQFNFVDKGPFGITGRTLLVELVATTPEICLRAIFEGPLRFEKKLDSVEAFDSVAVQFEGCLHFDALEIAV